MRQFLLATATAAAAFAFAAPASAVVSFAGVIEVAGEATDLSTLGNTANDNRLSFGSDLTYHARTGTFYGVTDRGPGGGLDTVIGPQDLAAVRHLDQVISLSPRMR